MRKLSLLAALFAVFAFTGCDDTTEENTTGTALKSCTADADCDSAKKEVCHPVGKTCVGPTCTAAADCEATAKDCGPMQAAGATKICKCQSDQLCGDGKVCSQVDQVCTSKCTADSGCPTGRKCDTATGQCQIVNTDCTAAGFQCPAGQQCNTTTKACEAIPACTDAASCQYGQYCNAGVCTSATGSCSAATSYVPSAFVANQSPVVWGVTATTVRTETTSTKPCFNVGTKQIQKYEGKWYDPQGDVSTTGTWGKITYITKTGSNPGTGGNTYELTTITKDSSGKGGTFSFELCEDVKALAGGVTIWDGADNESNVACF